MSRTSVRQALIALRTVGFVEAGHGGGIYLRAEHPVLSAQLVGTDRVLPLVVEVREALELQIARPIAARRSAADLERIAGALAAMEADVEAGRDAAEADERFRAAVPPWRSRRKRAARRPHAAGRRAGRAHAPCLAVAPSRAAQSLAGHRRVAEAIKRRDAVATAAAMRVHLEVVAGVTMPLPRLHTADGPGP